MCMKNLFTERERESEARPPSISYILLEERVFYCFYIVKKKTIDIFVFIQERDDDDVDDCLLKMRNIETDDCSVILTPENLFGNRHLEYPLFCFCKLTNKNT